MSRPGDKERTADRNAVDVALDARCRADFDAERGNWAKAAHATWTEARALTRAASAARALATAYGRFHYATTEDLREAHATDRAASLDEEKRMKGGVR